MEGKHYGVYVHCERDAWRVVGVFDDPEDAGKQAGHILKAGNFNRVEVAELAALPKNYNLEPF